MLVLGLVDTNNLSLFPFGRRKLVGGRMPVIFRFRVCQWMCALFRDHCTTITVTAALLLDQLCMMLVVPVIPLYLMDHNPNETSAQIQEKSGLIVATKGLVQVITSLLVSSPLTNKLGYSNSLVMGLLGMALACEVFALSGSMAQLLIARALQGVSSSIVNAAGLSYIAHTYRGRSAHRDTAMGVAMSAMCIGYATGPSFASLFYSIGDKPLPFHISTVIMITMSALVSRLRRPRETLNSCHESDISDDNSSNDGENVLNGVKIAATTAIKGRLGVAELLCDGYIILCLTNIVVSCLAVSALEAVLTVWMSDNIPEATEATVGLVWLPSSVAMLTATYVTTALMSSTTRYHRQIIQFALVIIMTASVLLPNQQTPLGVSACLTLLMFGEMQVETAVVPLISDIIDQRYGKSANYGSGYALWDMAYSAVETVGPLMGATIVAQFGMGTFMLSSAIICALMLPVNNLLNNVTATHYSAVPNSKMYCI